MVWQAVIGRFEQRAPANLMARLTLDQARPAGWIDEVFEADRQRQYPRELLFSPVVELLTLVSLGLRPSLHAAARKLDERLPVSLATLYEKANRCEPAVPHALRCVSSELPPEHPPCTSDLPPPQLLSGCLRWPLASSPNSSPAAASTQTEATQKGPVARSHVATARVIKGRTATP